jgi:hypothetical protein
MAKMMSLKEKEPLLLGLSLEKLAYGFRWGEPAVARSS